MDKDDLFNMPFDQYQRYRICQEVVNIIQEGIKLKPITILDVGGYFKDAQGLDTLPIRKFFPQQPITAVDIVDSKVPGYIRGSGTHLPFRTGAFDVVICMDTLEHIPQNQRDNFLHNLLRVAKKFVILSAPFFSEQVNLAEKILFEFILKTLKAEHQQLKEHISNQLPLVDKVRSLLDQNGFPYCFFEGAYLNNFLLMMIIKHYLMSFPGSAELHAMIDRFYNLHFYESDQRAPGYRKTFVIAKDQANDKILRMIQHKFSCYAQKYKYSAAKATDFYQLPLLLNLEQLCIKGGVEEQLQQIQALKGELALIKNSRVRRLMEFCRGLIYMRLLGKFPLIRKGALTISREGFLQFLCRAKDYLGEKFRQRWSKSGMMTKTGRRKMG